jgi:hypothetical protein
MEDPMQDLWQNLTMMRQTHDFDSVHMMLLIVNLIEFAPRGSVTYIW